MTATEIAPVVAAAAAKEIIFHRGGGDGNSAGAKRSESVWLERARLKKAKMNRGSGKGGR